MFRPQASPRYTSPAAQVRATIDFGMAISEVGSTSDNNEFANFERLVFLVSGRTEISRRLKIVWNQQSVRAFMAVKGDFILNEQTIAILVVDDEPLLRIFAVDFLTDAGFMVYEASNADEALEVLGSRPDIFAVFTDIQMPGTLDGIGLARRIKKTWPGIFVIVTSGQQVAESGELSDDVPFLTKPYLPETVAAMIRQKLSPQIVHAPVSE